MEVKINDFEIVLIIAGVCIVLGVIIGIIVAKITDQAQTIAEQGIRLDTVNRIGKEACEELDQLQNENTEQAEEIRQMKDGLISVRKSTEIMEARRFADQALGKREGE